MSDKLLSLDIAIRQYVKQSGHGYVAAYDIDVTKKILAGIESTIKSQADEIERLKASRSSVISDCNDFLMENGLKYFPNVRHVGNASTMLADFMRHDKALGGSDDS